MVRYAQMFSEVKLSPTGMATITIHPHPHISSKQMRFKGSRESAPKTYFQNSSFCFSVTQQLVNDCQPNFDFERFNLEKTAATIDCCHLTLAVRQILLWPTPSHAPRLCPDSATPTAPAARMPQTHSASSANWNCDWPCLGSTLRSKDSPCETEIWWAPENVELPRLFQDICRWPSQNLIVLSTVASTGPLHHLTPCIKPTRVHNSVLSYRCLWISSGWGAQFAYFSLGRGKTAQSVVAVILKDNTENCHKYYK